MNNLIVDTMTNRVNKLSFNKIVVKEDAKETYIMYDVTTLQNNDTTTILQFVNNETLTEAIHSYGYKWLS